MKKDEKNKEIDQPSTEKKSENLMKKNRPSSPNASRFPTILLSSNTLSPSTDCGWMGDRLCKVQESYQAFSTQGDTSYKCQEISTHPIHCLHLRNVDEREMAYVNMRNRTKFYQPRSAYMAYEPSEMPLYMRNSVMVKQPPQQKDSPIRCLHMRNM